jgi:tetratricopeptide (TPR) repeat protein
VTVGALLQGCSSALVVGSLSEEPRAAADPASERQPSRPVTEAARIERESWSQLVRSGRQHLRLQELSEAEDSFTRAYDLTRGFRNGDVRTNASVRNLQRLADAYRDAQDSASFGRVVELLVFIGSDNPVARNPEVALLLQQLAATRLMQDRPTEAIDLLLLSLSMLEEDEGAGESALVGVHAQLGIAHLEAGDLVAAEAEIDRAAEIATATEERKGPLYILTLTPRAKLELAKGNTGNGREAMREAVEITEEELGTESLASAQIVREFAVFERETGRNDQAEMHFDRVIAIWDALPGEQYQRAQSRNELAWFLVETGQPALAEAPARSGLGMLEEQGIGGQPMAGVADTLATSLRDQEKYLEAEPLYQIALAEGAKATGLPGWDVSPIADRYAELLDLTGRPEDAEELRRKWRAPDSLQPDPIADVEPETAP